MPAPQPGRVLVQERALMQPELLLQALPGPQLPVLLVFGQAAAQVLWR